MGLVVGLAVLGLLVGLAVLVGVAVRNKVRNTVVSFLVIGAYMAGLTWTSMPLQYPAVRYVGCRQSLSLILLVFIFALR